MSRTKLWLLAGVLVLADCTGSDSQAHVAKEPKSAPRFHAFFELVSSPLLAEPATERYPTLVGQQLVFDGGRDSGSMARVSFIRSATKRVINGDVAVRIDTAAVGGRYRRNGDTITVTNVLDPALSGYSEQYETFLASADLTELRTVGIGPRIGTGAVPVNVFRRVTR